MAVAPGRQGRIQILIGLRALILLCIAKFQRHLIVAHTAMIDESTGIYHFEPVRLAILVPGNDKRAVNGIVYRFHRRTDDRS